MPEYLHPGVYIEETSFRGKSIEGVSTSTAGLVGRTNRGPEGKPTLVTSFAEFTRTFGAPFAIAAGAPANPGDYLGHAVRAFFDNGGKRAYIVRTLTAGSTALKATSTLGQGTVVTLAPNTFLRAGTQVVRVTSLRGVQPGATLKLFVRPNPDLGYLPSTSVTVAVSGLDPSRNTITLSALLDSATNLHDLVSVSWQNAYFTIATAATLAGPVFTARDKGDDGNQLAVQVRPSDRPPVQIQAGPLSDTMRVPSTAGFYSGAIVEVSPSPTAAAKVYATVLSVDPPNHRVRLDTSITAVAGAYLRTLEIDIVVYDGGAVAEAFTGLSWNRDQTTEAYARYYVTRLNDQATGSKLVTVAEPPATPANLVGQPTSADGQPQGLGGGANGNVLVASDLIGNDGGPGNRTGIEALRERDDIALVAVPGVTDPSVQQALVTHCELLKYRFAVLDGLNTSDIAAIEGHRNHYDTKYAGYYTPWLQTMELATGRTMTVPPSGHVLGICARVDNERGVWKAPANEVVRNVLDVELPFGDGEQDVLNPEGINLIRAFDGRGIRVWGGRTLSSDSEWKYVNIRRLFIYLEHSIDRGTQWVVFEPNNESLWQRVVDTIDSFLFGVWKAGALMGTTPEQAYFVRCDRSTMTQDDIDNGRLVCLIGVAPAYPAEFVIFRIGQFTASTNQA
jgi:phage tail sheath protein FI